MYDNRKYSTFANTKNGLRHALSYALSAQAPFLHKFDFDTHLPAHYLLSQRLVNDFT